MAACCACGLCGRTLSRRDRHSAQKTCIVAAAAFELCVCRHVFACPGTACSCRCSRCCQQRARAKLPRSARWPRRASCMLATRSTSRRRLHAIQQVCRQEPVGCAPLACERNSRTPPTNRTVVLGFQTVRDDACRARTRVAGSCLMREIPLGLWHAWSAGHAPIGTAHRQHLRTMMCFNARDMRSMSTEGHRRLLGLVQHLRHVHRPHGTAQMHAGLMSGHVFSRMDQSIHARLFTSCMCI